MSIFSKVGMLFRGDFPVASGAVSGFEEVEPFEEGFSKHYHAHLRPHVSSFEERRIAALKKASRRARIGIPLLTITSPLLLIALIIAVPDDDGGLMGAVAILIGLGYWYISQPIRKYKQNIKGDIFPNILNFLGDFKYNPECGKRVSMLEPSGLVPSHDKEASEDEIIGTYKDVEIDFFETELKRRRRDSKGRTSYSTVFDGVFITLSMNKNFSGHTMVRRDAGAIGNWFKDKFSKLERVELEDPIFEKKFQVYSSDQVEARYLLTTSFMERLLDLGDAFDSNKLECSFYENRLLIKIDVTENLFEPGSIFEPEDFIDDAKTVLADMHQIFRVIDTLKLDQNIKL